MGKNQLNQLREKQLHHILYSHCHPCPCTHSSRTRVCSCWQQVYQPRLHSLLSRRRPSIQSWRTRSSRRREASGACRCHTVRPYSPRNQSEWHFPSRTRLEWQFMIQNIEETIFYEIKMIETMAPLTHPSNLLSGCNCWRIFETGPRTDLRLFFRPFCISQGHQRTPERCRRRSRPGRLIWLVDYCDK